MTIGRTKAEAVVKYVLAPKAVGDVFKALTSGKPLPFSIQTVASNKGNKKMFPLAVQYFSPVCGVTNKMLDFMENADESAAGICWEKRGLTAGGIRGTETEKGWTISA